MKTTYKKIFDFKKLVKTKDSWGDYYIQIRGNDFPEEMKKFKRFKIKKLLTDNLLNLIHFNIDDYILYEGFIQFKNLENAYLIEFVDIDVYIQERYFDFANKICPNAKIFVSSQNVFWANGENLINDWAVAVATYPIKEPFTIMTF